MHERPTGEDVYARLKRGLTEGALAPADRIETAALASQLEVSTTPVREAIMRLVGEGLLELHARGGARPLPMSEPRLRRLLELQLRLVLIGLDLSPQQAMSIPDAAAVPQGLEGRALLRDLVTTARDPDLLWLFDRLADRLAPFLHHEQEVIAPEPEEAQRLRAAANQSKTLLRRELRRWHRRRAAVAGPLVWRALVVEEP